MRETMKIIFIAGPDNNEGIEAARRYKEILAKNDVGVYSYYDLVNGLDNASLEYKKHLCEKLLHTTASAVLALPGWEQNEIAKEAVAYAKSHSAMEVFYPKLPNIDDKELRKVIGWGRALWLVTLKK